MTPRPPQRIGKYEVLAELGRGAMGTVYKARDPVLDRLVALKTMSEPLLVEEEMRERFYREARSAARLQHLNIVTIYELGDFEGMPFIAMELLEGESLAALMEQARLERLEEKLRLVVQICRGLDYAHKRGVIHRDIKPGNIQVLPDGTVKILDFGIALREGSTIKTKTGLVMGTPNYMAPEQIAGAVVDHRADMWAVGVILFELLTGRRPFDAETIPSLVYRIVHSPLPSLDPARLGLSSSILEVVEKALYKEPDGRFRDLAEMAAALQRVLGLPVSDEKMPEEVREQAYRRNLELARTLLSRDQPARALEAARRAQALEPSRAEVVSLVGEIETHLARSADEPTLVTPPAPPAKRDLEVDKWLDEARLALTAGRRTEALRIVEDLLTIEPSFAPAIELRDILEKPAAPGRARSGAYRSYSAPDLRLRRELAFREVVTFGESLGIQAIAVPPREHLLAVGGVDGSIRLWSLATQSKIATLRSAMHLRAGHEGLVTSLVFSADGAFLASGHVDGAIHVWSLDTGEELAVRLGHDASVGAIAFSPDGDYLASGGMDATLKLWDMAAIRSGEARRRLIRQPAGVSSLAYARDGGLIVTGHANRLLRVHDASSGRLTLTLRGHQAAVSVLAASPEGTRIASGGQDRTVRIFDLQRRGEISVLEGHKRAISSLAFFPDGAQLASVAMENCVILWSLNEATPKATLWGAAGESFCSVQVFGGGHRLAAALADGRIRLWSAS